MKNLFAKKNKTKKGFTLIEMMVSIFIFALMMTSIAGIFARQISSYKQTRIMANDLENAQFALNYIAKTLRTSSIIGYYDSTSGGSTNLMHEIQAGPNNNNDFYGKLIDKNTSLIIYDFSQEACIKLTFRDENYPTNDAYGHNALWLESQTGTVGIDEIEGCLDTAKWKSTSSDGYKLQRLTTGDVSGYFYVAPTRYHDEKGSRGTDTIGRATVTMSVVPSEYADDDHVAPVHIQSTTSLRDYPSDLSF